MKIKVKLNAPGIWNECWLQTKYIKADGEQPLKEQFRVFLYPTAWSWLYRIDGYVLYMSQHAPILELKPYLKQVEYFLNQTQEINERPLTAMQKISNFFKRVFSWKCKA